MFECAEGVEGVTSGVTYAEMDKADKNKVSHRAKAFEQLKAFMASKKAKA